MECEVYGEYLDQVEEVLHASARCTRWGMLLGDAGLDPQASRHCLDSRRLYWRRHPERDLPQSWHSCGGDRNRLRYSGDELISEEHTSELQSLMRTSYAVFCLKKKINSITNYMIYHHHTAAT